MLIDSQENIGAVGDLQRTWRTERDRAVLWLGAGVAKWYGLPLWDELATTLHHRLRRAGFAVDRRIPELIHSGQLPEALSRLESPDPTRFRKELLDALVARGEASSTYPRLLRAINALGPCRHVTTNTDQRLEQDLRVDSLTTEGLERWEAMREIGCIAKIHGTTAAPATLVFTTADYERAESDELLTSFLDKLFQSHIVLFIGYGLRDRYIIDRLVEARRLRPLTGVGPHFVIALDKMEVPVGVRAIRYRAAPHADHRTALQVLEELVAGPRVRLGNEGLAPGSARSFASVHVVADLLPPGKYTTSQRLTIQGEDVNDTKSVVIGSGLIDAEREDRVSTAAFDILVGLVAFDQIALSLKQIPLLHRLLGSAGFWELVHDGAVLPYHETAEVGVIESESRPKSGELRDFTVFEHDRSPYDVQRALTRMLPAAPGKEAAAAAEIALLAALVVRVDPWPTATFSETTRGLLVRPSLRDLLGISQLIPRDTIPKWYRFPVLRLARIMQVARVCEILRSPSVQFASGNQVIAGVVFGAVTTNTLLGPAVSYITRGRYDLQGAEAMFANPQRVSGLVSFRRSPEAQALRREVLRALSVDAGADAVGAINGGLSAALGVETLQAARDRFSQVGVGTVGAAIPAIWTESRYDQRALSLWRQRSLGELELECQALRLGRDDPCPCGSQERVRECCQRALRGERH